MRAARKPFVSEAKFLRKGLAIFCRNRYDRGSNLQEAFHMQNQAPKLVIMAAGMGSRFGGLKQMEPVDDEGHSIIDFSMYDARRALPRSGLHHQAGA